jgi:hypothetical protein
MRCFLGSTNRLLKRQISLVLQSVKYISLLRVEYIQALEYNRRKYENVRKWEFDIKINLKRTVCVMWIVLDREMSNSGLRCSQRERESLAL